jgi:two-component system, cell cycle sensor histidine kinase and response regulator CckA
VPDQLISPDTRATSERDALSRLRLALEASGEVIFTTDTAGVFTYVNPEFEKVYGYSSSEVVGRSTPRLLKGGATSVDEYRSLWQKLANHEVVLREFVNSTKDGRLVQVESSANPIVEDGICVGFLAVQRDITHRKAIETALRESEARYRTLAEAAPDSIFIVNRDATIEYANAISAERFGLRAEDVVGRTLHEVLPAGPASDIWRELLQVFETGQRHSFEATFGTPKGDLWLEAWLVPMPLDGSGRSAVMGVARDISDRVRLQQQFVQAQKMEAIGRLAGGIAHDFNNLLTAILGYSELLLDRVRHDASLAADVEEVKKAGERASRLTKQLLAFSRQQVLEPQVVDLNAIVTEMQKLLVRVIGEDVRLDVITEPGLLRVTVDPGQIEQLILNLAINARDAMPQGGSLRITTATATVDEELARRHHGASPGQFVAVSVADSGCGMPADVLAHIFEPFFTTKPAGKGTGLGLATVFGVVKQSGGFMTVASTVGAGSTFTAYVPVTSKSTDASRPQEPGTDGMARETILLVEDEVGIRQLMQRTLERRGYTVLAATSGDDAMRIAGSWSGEIHLLLSDVVMPDVSGPALAQRMIRLRPLMRVLYVSGFPNRVGAGTHVLSRHAALLSKPFAPHALALKVRECLDTRS